MKKIISFTGFALFAGMLFTNLDFQNQDFENQNIKLRNIIALANAQSEGGGSDINVICAKVWEDC